jgi:hypothetical protein
VVDQFWGSGEKEAHRKNELCSDVRSVGGERRRGRHPGVVVDSSWCGKVEHGGAVLRVVMASSEGAGAALRGGGNQRHRGGDW